jgi:hypothetical protein
MGEKDGEGGEMEIDLLATSIIICLNASIAASTIRWCRQPWSWDHDVISR